MLPAGMYLCRVARQWMLGDCLALCRETTASSRRNELMQAPLRQIHLLTGWVRVGPGSRTTRGSYCCID